MSHETGASQCSFVSIHYIICECGETFPSESDLKAHLETEHPQKRERKEYKCGVCGVIYRTEEACIQHYEEAHIGVSFDEEYLDHEHGYQEQEEKPELGFDGEIVAETEVSGTDVAQVQEYILSADGFQQQFQNQILKQELEDTEVTVSTVASEVVLQDLPRGLPPVRTRRPRQPRTDADGPRRRRQRVQSIVCEVCGKNYASGAALRYHQRVHTGERPYKCHLCPKTFAMPLFLQIHVRTHTGERPFCCHVCPKAFGSKAALLRHDRVHTGEKPYKCPMCVKTFSQSNSMKLHVTTVHLKQPTPYKSRNRKLKDLQISPDKVNPRKRLPLHIDTVEIIKHGLDSYVLGPLKAEMQSLKSDIERLSKRDLEAMTAVESIEKMDSDSEETCYEVVESELVYEDDSYEEVVYEA